MKTFEIGYVGVDGQDRITDRIEAESESAAVAQYNRQLVEGQPGIVRDNPGWAFERAQKWGRGGSSRAVVREVSEVPQ